MVSSVLSEGSARQGAYVGNVAAWLACMAVWWLCDYIAAFLPSGGRPLSPATWQVHLLVTLYGLISCWCMARTALPVAANVRVGARLEVALSVLVGALFGALALAIDQVTGASAALEKQLGSSLNVDFPRSLFVYTGGAIALEFQYRLMVLPIALWLLSAVILKGRWAPQTFWSLAVLTSTAEPILQGVPLYAIAGGSISAGAFSAYFVHSFAFNLACAYFLRSGGVIAAVATRWGNYMVWHVMWGAWTQYQG